MRAPRFLVAAAAVACIGGLAGCSGRSAKAAVPSHLNGLFRLAAGQCTTADARPTGSYLIVVSAAANKAARNPGGGCANADYTPLRPGADGGLRTGVFQLPPSPAFDAHRNSRSAAIITPVAFGAFRFGFATSPRDEQDAPTGALAYPAPAATVSGTTLNVDLRSLVVGYAGGPGSTCAKSYGLGCWDLGSKSAGGTYDAATHQFVIDWFAGESFTPKGDSIEVHLAGTFVPRAA
jgi:hypothetical protein